MKVALIISETECAALLEPYFQKAGIFDNIRLQNTELDSRPFGVSGIEQAKADAFIKKFGSKKRDKVFLSSGQSSGYELLLSEETVKKILSTALEPNRIDKCQNIEHIEFCDGGFLLTLSSHTITKTQDTIYGGFAVNMKSGEDVLMFTTSCSALLAKARAKERAEEKNKWSKDGAVYDTDSIHVRSQNITAYTLSSQWTDLEE